MAARFLCLLIAFAVGPLASAADSDGTCSKLAASPSTSHDCPKMSTTERTFIAVKPDGVQRNLVSKIIGRFEERGYKLVAIKMVHASKEHLQVHYQDLKDKPFFNGLIEYMTSGPIVATVWEGLDVVKQGRKILGATNPLQSEPGTIRGDLCIQTGRNVCHGSDSVESANREIKHWFKDDELVDWKPAAQPWVYE